MSTGSDCFDETHKHAQELSERVTHCYETIAKMCKMNFDYQVLHEKKLLSKKKATGKENY